MDESVEQQDRHVVSVYPVGSWTPEWTGSIAAFVEANEMGSSQAAELAALDYGDHKAFGGGAAQAFRVVPHLALSVMDVVFLPEAERGDGIPFSCTVLVDGVEAFIAVDFGAGEDLGYRALSPETEELLDRAYRWAQSLPAFHTSADLARRSECSGNLDDLLCLLVEQHMPEAVGGSMPRKIKRKRPEPRLLDSSMPDEEHLETLAFRLPYDRKQVLAFLGLVSERYPSRDDMTGLVVVVDHRPRSARAWVLVTCDTSRAGGVRACRELATDPPHPRDNTMAEIEYVVQMAHRGEWNMIGLLGRPDRDRSLLDQCWPPLPAGIH